MQTPILRVVICQIIEIYKSLLNVERLCRCQLCKMLPKLQPSGNLNHYTKYGDLQIAFCFAANWYYYQHTILKILSCGYAQMLALAIL